MNPLLNHGLVAVPVVKTMLNVGAGFDIPTGMYLEGRRGERILNGGLSPLTGVTGSGNSFKSTLMHYLMLTALSRFAGSTASTYDTEMNIQEWHLKEMISRTEAFRGEDVLDSGRWLITDKTVYTGNKWYEAVKEFLESKTKNAAKIAATTPFWNRDRSGPLVIIQPTFNEIDSFSEFDTEDIIKMQDANELGESGANTIYMRQSLAKNRFLMEAPRLNSMNYNFLLMVAHLGMETQMQNTGPGGQQPIQKLKYLKGGQKMKGVPDKFTFVTHNCYHNHNSAPLINDSTKGPEYPRDGEDNLKFDTDLNVVSVRNLRSKSGISGISQMLLVSQTEGVLPSLTEFHHIKEHGRYGLEGSNINYSLALLPDVKLQRTTVRGKIDGDAKLRRALNITSEMCQMSYLWHTLEEGILCTPKELYDDLKALGYNWDQLLDTRGWWTCAECEEGLQPFLSTMDLLRMRKKLYVPYWMDPADVPASCKDVPHITRDPAAK